MVKCLKSGKNGSAGGSVAVLHISVMLFGLSAVLGQFVDAPAVVIAGGRVVFASLTLLFFSLATKASLKLKYKKDYALALATGIVLAIHWTTFFNPYNAPPWPSAPLHSLPSPCFLHF